MFFHRGPRSVHCAFLTEIGTSFVAADFAFVALALLWQMPRLFTLLQTLP